MHQQISADDELDICKVRLQLKEEKHSDLETQGSRLKIIKNLSYTTENKRETVNLLCAHEVIFF